MSSFDIIIRVHRLSSYSIANLDTKLEDDTLYKVVEAFSNYIKNLFGLLIEEATYSSRYKGKWEPKDSLAYIEYLGEIPEGNIIEYLSEALEVRKAGSTFIVSINRNYKYPKSRRKLVDVLRTIEYGNSKIPARPIIMRARRLINSNILKLWRGFLHMKSII